MTEAIKASTAIPAAVRITLTVLEPMATIYGIFLGIVKPDVLMSDHFSRGTIAYAPETKTLYTQLSGMWAFFAFVEAFVLGSFDDLRLWRRICVGFLVCDVFFYQAMAEAVGGWTVFLSPSTAWDWINLLMPVAYTAMRLYIVLGIKVNAGPGKRSGKGE
jgi:hypothetical protein